MFIAVKVKGPNNIPDTKLIVNLYEMNSTGALEVTNAMPFETESVEGPGNTVLATADELILLSPNDEFIEKLSASVGIPQQIQNIGLHHGLPILQTRQGMWRGDYILEDWQNISLQGVSWSRPVPVPEQAQQQLARYFHGQGISVERFVLDLHNGRILSAVGIWLLDILAVLLIVLSLSGLWIWTRTRY
jgi:hypothetical protein